MNTVFPLSPNATVPISENYLDVLNWREGNREEWTKDKIAEVRDALAKKYRVTFLRAHITRETQKLEYHITRGNLGEPTMFIAFVANNGWVGFALRDLSHDKDGDLCDPWEEAKEFWEKPLKEQVYGLPTNVLFHECKSIAFPVNGAAEERYIAAVLADAEKILSRG